MNKLERPPNANARRLTGRRERNENPVRFSVSRETELLCVMARSLAETSTKLDTTFTRLDYISQIFAESGRTQTHNPTQN